MVQASLLTGARYGELCGLKVRDIDLKVGTIWFPATKGGKARVVYLEEEGKRLISTTVAGKPGDELVFPRPDGKKWGPSQQGRYLQQASDNGNVEPRAGYHDLRRTYGARLAMQGVPMALISEAMGHADERITRRHYAHLAPSYVSGLIRERAAGLGIVERGAKIVTTTNDGRRKLPASV